MEKMLVRRGFKYRIYPAPETEQILRSWQGSLRFLWNLLLEQKFKPLDEYIHGRPYHPTRYIDQQSQIPDARKYDERLGDVPSCARQGVLRDLEAAWSLWESSKSKQEWAHDFIYRQAALDTDKDEKTVELLASLGLALDTDKITDMWRAPGLIYMARERQRSILKSYYKFHKIDQPEYKEVASTEPVGQEQKKNGKKGKKKGTKKKSKGMPHFKGFRDSVSMVLYTKGFVPSRHIKINADEEIGTIRLPGLGDVPVRYHRPIEGEVCTVSVVKDGPEWYVALSCKISIDDPGLSSKPIVAIDRGVVTTLVDSDGRRAYLPERIRKLDRRIDRLKSRNKHRDRDLPAKAPKSKKYKKNQDAISSDYRHLRRIRRQWSHEQALYYAENYSVVIIEDLKITNMTASAKGTDEEPGHMVKQKSGLNRSILEQGWYAFQQLLSYKLQERGGMLVSVPAQYSSQTCSRCGCVDGLNRKSSEFRCVNCGYEADADYNAAQVLLQRYKAGQFEKIGGYGFEAVVKSRVRRIKRKKKTEEVSAVSPAQ